MGEVKRYNLFKISIFLEMFLGIATVDAAFILTMKHLVFLFRHIKLMQTKTNYFRT